MPLDLASQCQRRLEEVLTEALGHAKVRHNMFFDRRSLLPVLIGDSVLPKHGPVQKKLEQYVGEYPFFNFVDESLSRELHEADAYTREENTSPLSSSQGYQDLPAVAKRLVSAFNSLPWAYTLTIQLAEPFAFLLKAGGTAYELGGGVRLIIPDASFGTQFPLKSGIKSRDEKLAGGSLLLGLAAPEWKVGGLHLQVEAQGFIGIYGESEPFAEAVRTVKAFFGLAIAVDLATVRRPYRAVAKQAKFFVHRRVNDSWVVERGQELDRDVSEALMTAELHSAYKRDVSDDVKAGWLAKDLENIKCVFSNGEKAARIYLAAQWLFDAFATRNELLSFVQTTVCLEILLGDKAVSDLTGLGELLRNRCAYLIASKHSEREEILSDFQKIYGVRSKIVHQGKHKLTMEEDRLLTRLQWMCKRVVQEEIKLLGEDLKVPKA